MAYVWCIDSLGLNWVIRKMNVILKLSQFQNKTNNNNNFKIKHRKKALKNTWYLG